MAIPRAARPRSLTESRDIFSERAFEDLYHATFASVWGIARRVARNDEEAEDVCQKAYLVVFEYWSSGTLREPPAHLLYRVAKRGAIDVLRATPSYKQRPTRTSSEVPSGARCAGCVRRTRR
jgi:DNA-directed RNA polymerase specialized sigma24 family protein